MPGMARVGLGPPSGWRFAEIALPLRTLAAVDDPGSHLVREVARVSLVIEGELFERPVAGTSLFEFVFEVPRPAAAGAADGRHPTPGLAGVPVTIRVWFVLGHCILHYRRTLVNQCDGSRPAGFLDGYLQLVRRLAGPAFVRR